MRIQITEEPTKNIIAILEGKPEFLNGGVFVQGEFDRDGGLYATQYEEFFTNVSIIDIAKGNLITLSAVKTAASGTGEAPKQVTIAIE